MARDFATIDAALRRAMNEFDWPSTDELAAEMARLALRDPKTIDQKQARRVLADLRKKRCFRSLGLLAQALLQSGNGDAQVRRQLAQAAIDQCDFQCAELALKAAADDPEEKGEALGLLGRLYKQLYVEANRGDTIAPETKRYLSTAVEHYRAADELHKADDYADYWAAINLVALARRADADGLDLVTVPNPKQRATEIRANLLQLQEDLRERNPPRELAPFQRATLLESYVALGDVDGAYNVALEYAGPAGGADAFELGSTLRQLKEIWGLDETSPMGERLLPLLSAALLRRREGCLTLSAEQARNHRESVLGDDGFQDLAWYKSGLDRCRSIALIAAAGSNGKRGYGTGWLVDGEAFFGAAGQFILTNAHVVGPAGQLPLDRAEAVFEMEGITAEFDGIHATSPVAELDAVFLKLKQPVNLPVLPLAKKAPRFDAQLTRRLYIIGHPYGKDLSFSLQDNILLATPPGRLHYRTPTTNGSSGSPVFDQDTWSVVGLHREGRIPGERDANMGTSIHALIDAAHAGKLT